MFWNKGMPQDPDPNNPPKGIVVFVPGVGGAPDVLAYQDDKGREKAELTHFKHWRDELNENGLAVVSPL